jgi:hypothetical protein
LFLLPAKEAEEAVNKDTASVTAMIVFKFFMPISCR